MKLGAAAAAADANRHVLLATSMKKLNLDERSLDSMRSLTELTSQIFRVLSSDADTSRLESEDQATSDMPCRSTGDKNNTFAVPITEATTEPIKK